MDELLRRRENRLGKEIIIRQKIRNLPIHVRPIRELGILPREDNDVQRGTEHVANDVLAVPTANMQLLWFIMN